MDEGEDDGEGEVEVEGEEVCIPGARLAGPMVVEEVPVTTSTWDEVEIWVTIATRVLVLVLTTGAILAREVVGAAVC
jgi:hypothetical protein